MAKGGAVAEWVRLSLSQRWPSRLERWPSGLDGWLGLATGQLTHH